MKRLFLLITITLSISTFNATGSLLHAQSSDPDPIDVLRRLDEHRGIQDRAFLMEIVVESSQGNKSQDPVNLISYVDNQTSPNNWNTLIRLLSPERRRGQLMLLEQNRMWFYKVGTRRPIRISPAQRLMGEAANGDVAAINFREYYAIEAMVADKIGKVSAYMITLSKKKTSAPYDNVKVWADQSSNLPIKAEFYSRSGRKLKTSYYGKFKKILGILRTTEIVIVDGLKPENITKVVIKNMKVSKLTPNYFNPNQMDKIQF